MRKIGLAVTVILLSVSFSSQALAACSGGGGDDDGDIIICTPDGGGAESRASVLVTTKIINDNGGIALPSNVLMTYGDGLSVANSWAGTGEPGFLVSVAPGNYVIGGSEIPSYARIFSPDCRGVVVKDDFKTCIVTYDDVAMTSPACDTDCTPATSTDGVGGDPAAAVPPAADPSGPEELPRTGGSSLPLAVVVLAFGATLSLRKES